jgi:uncharacterized repeat protein (TIGR01451 family)
VSSGTPVTYTINVSNLGTQSATGVVLQDDWALLNFSPSGFTTTQGSCTIVAPGRLRCSLGTLTPFQSAIVTVTGNVYCLSCLLGGGPISVNNSATADPSNTIPESNEFNNNAMATLQVS